MKSTYVQDHFMGSRINCNIRLPCRINILEALYVLAYRSSQRFRSARGFHVRIRLTEKMNLSTFTARLTMFYMRKSGYKPLRVVVKENDPLDGGVHYHLALILEDKLDRKSSLQFFLSKLHQSGFLHDYKVVPPDSDCYGQHIRDCDEMDQYFRWVSYIAKSSTKVEKMQALSYCKDVGSDLKGWVENGKPKLRQSRQFSVVDRTGPLDAFCGLSPVNPVGVYMTGA